MSFHSWVDNPKSVSSRRRIPGVRTRNVCCRSPAGHQLVLEPLEDRTVLSVGLSPTLVALGGATPRPIPMQLALAASTCDPPGFDIYQNFQGPADTDPSVSPLIGNEPNQITDFNGVYGGVRVQGDGIGHQGIEPNHSFFWDADL